jgi:hypothetical protein
LLRGNLSAILTFLPLARDSASRKTPQPQVSCSRIVNAGHDPSFGRERLLELIDQYLERRQEA